MPRPKRIEYEHAFYHVMNRGRGRQTIFHGPNYCEAFLKGLEESHDRFSCVIHAYCLMVNHYHLLVETPKANLSRVMRHVNGIYTQRYNRLRKTDGPLFRGRFKSILVDADAYLLQLSRYIHRNPIDMKRPLVQQLMDYRWSSYPAYIDQVCCPPWLHRDFVYQLLAKKTGIGYAEFVSQGLDEETERFYKKNNLAALIGDSDFKEHVYEELLTSFDSKEKRRAINLDITIEEIVTVVAQIYNTTPDVLRTVVKGPQRENEARKISMYLCQEVGGIKLVDIAHYFNLSNISSVSSITHQIRDKKRGNSDVAIRLDRLTKSIIKKAT